MKGSVTLARRAGRIDVEKVVGDRFEFDSELTRHLTVGFTEYRPHPHTEWVQFYRDGAFPPGLLTSVANWLEGEGWEVLVTDYRKMHRVDPTVLKRMELWEHQQRIVTACLTHTVGIAKASTGSGKTRAMTAVVASLPTVRWLLVVHRDHLREQIAEELERWLPDEEIGVVAAGVFKPRRITTATFDSLRNLEGDAVKVMTEATGIIVDEAHTAAASTWNAVVRKCYNAVYRLGFSGTPLDRSDRRSVLAVAELGSIIVEVTTSELIKKGVLATADCYFVIHDHTGWYQGKYPYAYKHGIVNNTTRHGLICDIVDKAPKPCIVFFKVLKHGRDLRKMIEARGHNVQFVDGGTSKGARKDVKKDVKHGKVDVIVASVVFNEGVDIPDLRSVVNAASGKSTIQTLQKLGRGLRKTKDKDTVYIFDIYDCDTHHLMNHSKARYDDIAAEGHPVRALDFEELPCM